MPAGIDGTERSPRFRPYLNGIEATVTYVGRALEDDIVLSHVMRDAMSSVEARVDRYEVEGLVPAVREHVNAHTIDPPFGLTTVRCEAHDHSPGEFSGVSTTAGAWACVQLAKCQLDVRGRLAQGPCL